jgi:hypothetical protein
MRTLWGAHVCYWDPSLVVGSQSHGSIRKGETSCARRDAGVSATGQAAHRAPPDSTFAGHAHAPIRNPPITVIAPYLGHESPAITPAKFP